MITRTSLANEIDEYDQQIADMNSGKKDCYDAYRQQLVEAGFDKANIKCEIDAVKAAIKRRRAANKDFDALEEKDALIDEIFGEITAAPRAPRATRENFEQFDPISGEFVAAGTPSVGSLRAASKPLATRGPEESAVVDERAPALVHINSPETAMESPRKAAEAVSERTAPLVGHENGSAEAGIEAQASLTPVLTAQHGGVDVSGPERAGVTAGETAPNSEPSVAGGDHVSAHQATIPEARGDRQSVPGP